jgi:hypothetical protein
MCHIHEHETLRNVGAKLFLNCPRVLSEMSRRDEGKGKNWWHPDNGRKRQMFPSLA